MMDQLPVFLLSWVSSTTCTEMRFFFAAHVCKELQLNWHTGRQLAGIQMARQAAMH